MGDLGPVGLMWDQYKPAFIIINVNLSGVWAARICGPHTRYLQLHFGHWMIRQ